MKRKGQLKTANKKPHSKKTGGRKAETSQKTADIRPTVTEQVNSGERAGLEGGQIIARLSQADIMQLQQLHGNSYVQRLLADFKGKNGLAAGNGLQRQEEQEENRGSSLAGHSQPSGATAPGSSSSSTKASGKQTQQEQTANQGTTAHGSKGPETQSQNGATPGQNVQQAGPAGPGSTNSNGSGPATQPGLIPGNQEKQTESKAKSSHEKQEGPAPEEKDRGAGEQENRPEGNQNGESSAQDEANQAEQKTEVQEKVAPGKDSATQEGTAPKGTPGQKGSPGPEKSQAGKQEAQGPGASQTTGPGVSDSEAPSPVRQGGSPQSAQEDPDFQNTVNQVGQAAENQKAHPPGESKAQEAQAAAEPPASEVEARAQTNQAQEMEQAETPPFDAAGFKAQLMQQIQALTPGTAEGAEQFKSSNRAGTLKATLKGKVESEQKKSKGPLEEKTKQAPDTGAVPAKSVTPLTDMEAGEAPVIPGAEKAVPKPKSPGEVEEPLREGSQSLDEQMRAADITEQQLENSNEPEFTGALEKKQEAQERAREAPQNYREQEQEQISQAQSEAAGTAEGKMADMHGGREQALSQIGGKQGQTKSADERKRAQVAADIQAIYTRTQSNVEQILGDLDGRVDSIFNAGAESAKQAFENFVDSRMRAYKEERYSGAAGALLWLKDKFLGMPPEVNAFFSQGRELYTQQMDGVIDNVVTVIGESLQQARAAIATGKSEMEGYVAQLPADLQEVGQQAAGEMDERFNQLENHIDDTQNALIDELANLYLQHLQEVDNRVEAMRAETEGLLERALGAISHVIEMIGEFKDRLLSILSRAASAIRDIIQDPISFLGNLISAVSTGFQAFFGNITTHLTSGLIKWIAETLGEAGIDLPDSFDLKGIFGMVTQILGVTWETIRQRATSVLGEEIVGRLEQVFEVFVVLKNEGLAGIWDFILKTMGGLEEMILEPIKEFLVNEIIQNGIQKIVGFLGNPAGAFIQAIQGIYNVINFFVGRAQSVFSLVQAIMGSMADIVTGSVGTAANAIEQALAKAIPATISFLARLSGLGGLADKIKGIIQRIRAPIDRVTDKIINMAIRVGRSIGGALNGGEGEAQEGG